MKAIIQEQYGPPEVLQLREIEPPAIGDHEVRVRVRAAGINPGDWAMLLGIPYIARPAYGFGRPRNRVPGMDVAGVVEAVGARVTRLRTGDEVFGQGRGTFAELAACAEAHLVPKPARISFEQAAAIPVAGMTALKAMRDVAAVQPGQRVLITGAGGGVGSFAVQLARARGAHVTAVCSTSKVERVRELGADHVIDHTREDFTNSSERYDAILDNAGGHTLAQLRRVLTPRGTLMPNFGHFENRWVASIPRILGAQLQGLFTTQRLKPFLSLPATEPLSALKELIERGQLTPVVGETYPLADTAQALARLATGGAFGKIVVIT